MDQDDDVCLVVERDQQTIRREASRSLRLIRRGRFMAEEYIGEASSRRSRVLCVWGGGAHDTVVVLVY